MLGQLLVIGFRGFELPRWVREVESRFGLGGVILFDFDCQTRVYERNIHSPEQVKQLNREIAALPSRPWVMVDQEGGKVRRLKEKQGFAPLPSAKAFAELEPGEQRVVALRSFRELKELGFDLNLMPVVDLDLNPTNPDIGAVERSYTQDPDRLRAIARVLFECAREAGLALSLKHYPGLGGAKTNSHLELTDLNGLVPPEQFALFDELLPETPGQTMVVSHGIWGSEPSSLSSVLLRRARTCAPEALLISDDLQMEALQRKCPTTEATLRGIRAGLDWICVGNNLKNEEEAISGLLLRLEQEYERDREFRAICDRAIARVRARKT